MTTGQDGSLLTMVLVNWRRPHNIHLILDVLKSQSIRPKIFLWNNHPTPIFDSRADWVINSSLNVHAYPLPFLFRQAKTRFVGFQDDDLMPAHEKVLENAVETLERLDDPLRIVAAFGVRLERGRHYRNGEHLQSSTEDAFVDVVKARMMVLRRFAASKLSDEFGNHHVDLSISIQLAAKRRQFHVVGSCFHQGLIELPEGDVGYSRMRGHTDTRDAMTQAWLAKMGCATGSGKGA